MVIDVSKTKGERILFLLKVATLHPSLILGNTTWFSWVVVAFYPRRGDKWVNAKLAQGKWCGGNSRRCGGRGTSKNTGA
jgi:hypothetical protein